MQHLKRNTETGFGLLPILVALAVIAIAGGAGAYVYSHRTAKTTTGTTTDATPKKTTTTATTTPSTALKKVTTTKPIDPSDGGKYLVITEWGVRVLLPDSLKGNVFYGLREYDDTDGTHYEAADLNTKMFQPECRDTAADLGLDVIRSASTSPNTTGLTRVGEFWYGAIYGKDGCGKFLTGAKAQAAAELQTSIKTVEAIN